MSGKVYLATSANLELVPEKEHFPDVDLYLFQEEKMPSNALATSKNNLPSRQNTLDLHLEKLAPHMEGEPAGRILDYQLQQSDAFIRHAIHHNMPHITIIHGKGQGVLKDAISHQLSLFSQVKITFTKNGGGAVEVWL